MMASREFAILQLTVNTVCATAVGRSHSQQHLQPRSFTSADCIALMYWTERFAARLQRLRSEKTRRQLQIDINPNLNSGIKMALRFLHPTSIVPPPRAGSGVVRIDPLRFLTGCRTRRLNQAQS